MLLTKHFISKFNDKLYLQIKGITKKVESLFLSYSWPGNVRELEHVIKGAMHILDGTTIRLMDLPATIAKHEIKDEFILKSDDLNLKVALEQVEKQMIVKAMEASSDNITQAAKVLGLPRQTLQYKLKKLEIGK